VLLLRRLPTVLALRPLLGPLRRQAKDVLFLGWFGPIGAAALYYAAFSFRETGIEEAWVLGSLIIPFRFVDGIMKTWQRYSTHR
jgi:sodium/hydrogen antiporter